MLSAVRSAMFAYYAGDPKRIQHFLKVHAFAHHIGTQEGLPEDVQQTLEIAAYVHDIGIKPAEAKFGKCSGKLQEQEGGAPARALLEGLQVPTAVIDRVVYLVEHHHTYNPVDSLDYRILLESDFLVNAFEDALPNAAICAGRDSIFRTQSGISLLTQIYGI